jgi:hypothetical protein
MSLNQPAQRLCKEFYIEYAKEELHRMQGSENAALSNLEEIRLTILQTQCIFSCLKCKR